MMMKDAVSARLFHVAVLTLFAVSGTKCLHAQQNTLVAELKQPTTSTPTDAGWLNPSEDGLTYSSSTGADALAAAENYVASATTEAGQPPPRRRYGRPNYSDRLHNPDGSSKIAALVGGGFTVPVFDPSTKYLKLSYKIQGGVGYNFNKTLGVILQFDYDNFALPASLLTSQQAVYNSQNFTYSDGSAVDFSGLDGHTHVLALTLNPTFNFYQSDTVGAYAVVGGGFYHKVTSFQLPQTAQYCDYYYGCFQYQANQTFDSYTSNAAGVNGGLGITYKPSRFASERLYAEARYVFNFNQQRPGSNTNLFPGNSSTTSYVPVTVGIRF